MSARAAGAAAAAAVVALALVPWLGEPLRRLAGGEGDGPNPRFDVPLDAGDLRRAADRVRPGETYVAARTGAPLVQGNLKAAGQLYLAEALPVQGAPGAKWLLAYRHGHIQLLLRR